MTPIVSHRAAEATKLILTLIIAAVATERERCAKEAETFHDFGPSTQCPDCGSSDQVLHWYELGRKEAAKDIRGRNGD